MKIIDVFTTVGNEIEANIIAKKVVDLNLAACAQVSQVNSFYHWNGKVQNKIEFKILFKTIPINYKSIESLILSIHSYELPSIYSVQTDEILQPYQDWIIENSKNNIL